jgi:hypothetical protein
LRTGLTPKVTSWANTVLVSLAHDTNGRHIVGAENRCLSVRQSE